MLIGKFPDSLFWISLKIMLQIINAKDTMPDMLVAVHCFVERCGPEGNLCR
jgi:hypothetical protein